LLEVVNFSGRRATENLQLQLDCVVVGVYIEIGRDVELLSSLSIDVFLIMLLKILVLIQNAPCDNIDHDVGFAYIDQHVIFKDLRASNKIKLGLLVFKNSFLQWDVPNGQRHHSLRQDLLSSNSCRRGRSEFGNVILYESLQFARSYSE